MPAPVSVASRPASFLRKALGQLPTALGKGRDWVESITKTHSYLQPELLHSLQPVAEMAALLVMSKMQIMKKMGENMTFRKSHEQ